MTITSQHPEREIDLLSCRAYLTAAGLIPEDVCSVFCTGSVARGWSNPGSDYDIYVVSEGLFRTTGSASIRMPLDPGTVPVHIRYVDGRRWEIKYWTDGQIGQVLSKVSAACFEASDSYSLISDEELLLERIVTCLPIIGAEWVTTRRDDVRESAYREFVITRSLGYADKAAESALGQLAAFDLQSAVLSAHQAMRHTVDALLESKECYGTITGKWRARRMREATPAALSFEQYWSMETMTDLNPADPGDWVRRTISWCKVTAMEIGI